MAKGIEELKRRKDGLDVLPDIYRYAEQGFDSIPPDEMDLFKWHGLFNRRATPGFFMMRLRIPNGILDARQMAGLGRIANQYCRGNVDITTRQNVQLRWVRIEDVPAIFAALDGLGISHLQTGMDNVRNITGCPVAGLDPHEILDASAVARAIQDGIFGRKEFSNLPRKFNISISGCRDDCALSQTHDLGFTPASKDGVIGFHARVGGAMGGKSTTLSSDLDVFLEPHEVVDFCRAALSIFRDEGSRENRQHARLKWLLDEWGLERFRAELETRLGSTLASAGHDEVVGYGGDHIGVREQRQAGLHYVGCVVPVGRILADDLIEFARLADEYGTGDLRLTNDQNVVITSVPEQRLAALQAEALLQRFTPAPAPASRRLVSCTGNDFCHYSLIDTKGRAVEVAERLDVLLPDGPALRMHWSGCPHACGLHHIADIGFQATRVRIGDQIVDAADVFLGGKLGKNPALATRVLENVPISELPDRLVSLIGDHRASLLPSEAAAG
ncbi:MAG TPA: ferredoxin--nitrite reductase [Dehalococcoidia bacterium]|nr:ferredoxin--nitrite reductase [Dehalococcoidia bacterium]